MEIVEISYRILKHILTFKHQILAFWRLQNYCACLLLQQAAFDYLKTQLYKLAYYTTEYVLYYIGAVNFFINMIMKHTQKHSLK